MTKTAFVSGGMGLVGRHMRRVLEERDWAVSWCDLKPPSYSNAINTLFRRLDTMVKFDLVVHAAYHVGGRAAIDGKPGNLVQNLHLDAAMFEWAIVTGQPHVLYFSSSAAYPVALQRNLTSVRLQEDEIDLDYPEESDGRYGIAKLIGEQQARAARECGVNVTVVRPFSGYAADQDPDYPFRAFLERVKAGDDPFVVWGSTEQRRDWIHIDDVVKGALAVVDADTDEPVNLCTGQATSMGDLALLMMNGVGRDDMRIDVDDTKPMGVMNRVGDPTRFFQYYEPKITIEQGVHDALKEMGL